jgi:UDP-3-O-[3-hydroxymyristoyl] glucosamine N-acyltransferase
VTNDIPSGSFVSGSPHLDVRVWRKFWACAPQLYDLIKDVKKLRARVEELEKKR